MNNKEYFIVENKYLADALSFLGYRYYKFIDCNGKQVYSFKRTERLVEQVELLYKIKKENFNN